MLFPETPVDVQREAFGWPVKAWREDGTILCRGSTGVLSACHSMDGVIFCSGNDFAEGAVDTLEAATTRYISALTQTAMLWPVLPIEPAPSSPPCKPSTQPTPMPQPS